MGWKGSRGLRTRHSADLPCAAKWTAVLGSWEARCGNHGHLYSRIMSVVLQRETFATSRLLDFFSRKELTAQIGHGPDDWPLVIVKELVDNALDACEDGHIPPV